MSDPVQPGEEYIAEDLIVDLPHVPLVQERLRDMHVWSDDSCGYQENRTLDLALLTGLRNIGSGGSFQDLNAVLDKLRTGFADEFGGWTPDLGKNRQVAHPVAAVGGFARITLTLLGCPGRMCPMTALLAVGPPAHVDPAEFTPAFPGDGGAGILIGMLDTQVYPHERLRGHLSSETWLQAVDAKNRHSKRWRAWEGHATFVADLIATAAPQARIIARAVPGRDNGVATAWETATALATFVGSGIQILNLSMGCRTADGRPPLALSRAIGLLTPDILVVAAAGNHGGTDPEKTPTGLGETPIWPAALPEVVAVSTLESFGPKLPWVNCTAPADSLPAAYLDGDVVIPEKLPPRLDTTFDVTDPARHFDGYATMSGTSFAAAITSGLIASAMSGEHTAADGFHAVLAAGDVVKQYIYPVRKATLVD